MNKISEADKGYIAGMIDGEGQISITRHKTKSGYIYRNRLGIFNTNKKGIKFIKSKFKDFKLSKDKPNNKRHNICYRLHIDRTNKLLKFLEIIEPYLVIKRRQAKLLIKFTKIKLKIKRMEKKGQQEKMWKQSIKLNHRGTNSEVNRFVEF